MRRRTIEDINEEKKIDELRRTFEKASKDIIKDDNPQRQEIGKNFLESFISNENCLQVIFLIIQNSNFECAIFQAVQILLNIINNSFDSVPMRTIPDLFSIPAQRLKASLFELSDMIKMKLIECCVNVAVRNLTFIENFTDFSPNERVYFFMFLYEHLYSDKCTNYSQMLEKMTRYSLSVQDLLRESEVSKGWFTLFKYFVRMSFNQTSSRVLIDLLNRVKSFLSVDYSSELIDLFEEICTSSSQRMKDKMTIPFLSSTVELVLDYIAKCYEAESEDGERNTTSYLWNLLLDIEPEFYSDHYILTKRLIDQFNAMIVGYRSQPENFLEIGLAASNLFGILASQEGTPHVNALQETYNLFVGAVEVEDFYSTSFEKIFYNFSLYMGEPIVSYINQALVNEEINDNLLYAVAFSSKNMRYSMNNEIMKRIYTKLDQFRFSGLYMRKCARYTDPLIYKDAISFPFAFFDKDQDYFGQTIAKLSKYWPSFIAKEEYIKPLAERLLALNANALKYVLVTLVNVENSVHSCLYIDKIAEAFIVLPNAYIQQPSPEGIKYFTDTMIYIMKHIKIANVSEEYFAMLRDVFLKIFAALDPILLFPDENAQEYFCSLMSTAISKHWCIELEMIGNWLAAAINGTPIPEHFELAEKLIDIMPFQPLIDIILKLDAFVIAGVRVSCMRYVQFIAKWKPSVFLEVFGPDFVLGYINGDQEKEVVIAALNTLSAVLKNVPSEVFDEIWSNALNVIMENCFSVFDEDGYALAYRIIMAIAVRQGCPDQVLDFISSNLSEPSSELDDFVKEFANDESRGFSSLPAFIRLIEHYNEDSNSDGD